MRRVKRILLVLSMGLGAPSLAAAGDQLVMPYACNLNSGRVQLTPSPPMRYAIVGKREELAVTTCQGRGSDGCRTVMAHRFVISCGAAGVAWMRVAAAIRHAGAVRAWIDNDRLNVILPPRNATAAQPSCIDRPTYALGRTARTHRVSLTQDCRSGHRDVAHLVLPAGFAPIGELGARLNVDPSGGSTDTAVTTVAVRPGETVAARTATGPVVEPIPGLEPYDPGFDTSTKIEKWVTVVRASAGRGVGGSSDSSPGLWMWLLATMALATAAIITRVKFAHAETSGGKLSNARAAHRLLQSWFRREPGLRTAETVTQTRSGAAVAPLLDQTQSVVAQLKGSGPLRDVLLAELDEVRQRLTKTEVSAAQNSEDEARAAPLYRALVRELDRIRRIADSAAASLAGAPCEGTMPATRSEAYAVLGVNPDVSEGVLKRIVDALRMSWHPDHARDEDDRCLREARIRQINIAWELINAKHEPA